MRILFFFGLWNNRWKLVFKIERLICNFVVFVWNCQKIASGAFHSDIQSERSKKRPYEVHIVNHTGAFFPWCGAVQDTGARAIEGHPQSTNLVHSFLDKVLSGKWRDKGGKLFEIARVFEEYAPYFLPRAADQVKKVPEQLRVPSNELNWTTKNNFWYDNTEFNIQLLFSYVHLIWAP